MKEYSGASSWCLFLLLALAVFISGASACKSDDDDSSQQGTSGQYDRKPSQRESTGSTSSTQTGTAQNSASDSQGQTTQSTTTNNTTSNTTSNQRASDKAIIIDHTCTDLDAIPKDWIEKAKNALHVAYGHTSHGSQITSGMSGLAVFKGNFFAFSSGGQNETLDLRDQPFSGATDLGSPDRTAWKTATENYLKGHAEINVVIWAWCGQADTTPENIAYYLSLMDGLEKEYPKVTFVYMTGHLNGTGLAGNLHLRNNQIREFCKSNGKVLYDFEDIESYNPDGVYFGGKMPDDGCNYDSDGDGTRDENWAVQWQDSHAEGVEWYDCYAAHSQPLNANLKAYAAWWLFSRLAGWEG